MSTSVVHQCPDCKAEIGPDLSACLQCGADAGVWPESQRTPLILPGNPALSADVVRKRASIPKIALGATLVAVAIGAVLYSMPESEKDEGTRDVALAADTAGLSSATSALTAGAAAESGEPTLADSLSAFSGGDTALSRSIPSAAPSSLAPAVPAATPAALAPAGRRDEAAAPPAVPRPSAPRPDRAAPTAMPPADGEVPSRPMLTLSPVVSNTMLPGERLQLSWSVIDRRTRDPIRGNRVEFTSSDGTVASVSPFNGLVIARSPGSTRIIVDGGAAGRRVLLLVVRAPVPIPAVTVAPAPVSEAARRSAGTSAPPAVTAPSATAPSVAAAPAVPAAREAPRSDMPNDDDVRTVVDRFIRDVRRDAVRNFEVEQFLADGAEHRVTLDSGPTVVSNTGMGVRINFTLRFTKFDGGGRPVTRVTSIAMDVDKRTGQPASSAVAIGALRRP